MKLIKILIFQECSEIEFLQNKKIHRIINIRVLQGCDATLNTHFTMTFIFTDHDMINESYSNTESNFLTMNGS